MRGQHACTLAGLKQKRTALLQSNLLCFVFCGKHQRDAQQGLQSMLSSWPAADVRVPYSIRRQVRVLFSTCIDAAQRRALAKTVARLGGAVAPDGDEDFTHFVTVPCPSRPKCHPGYQPPALIRVILEGWVPMRHAAGLEQRKSGAGLAGRVHAQRCLVRALSGIFESLGLAKHDQHLLT